MRTLLSPVAAALLVIALAACAPTTPDTDSGTGTGTESDDTTSEETETETGGMLVLPGTGEYQSGDTMPIGGYQLLGEPDEQPAGCSWSLYAENGDVLAENQGIYVFITDVTGKFVTTGCPDWEQFE